MFVRRYPLGTRLRRLAAGHEAPPPHMARELIALALLCTAGTRAGFRVWGLGFRV